MTSAVFSEEDVCLLYTFVLIEMTGQEFSHLTVETRRVSVNHCFAGSNCLTTAVRALDGTRILTFGSRNPSSFCQPVSQGAIVLQQPSDHSTGQESFVSKNSGDHSVKAM